MFNRPFLSLSRLSSLSLSLSSFQLVTSLSVSLFPKHIPLSLPLSLILKLDLRRATFGFEKFLVEKTLTPRRSDHQSASSWIVHPSSLLFFSCLSSVSLEFIRSFSTSLHIKQHPTVSSTLHRLSLSSASFFFLRKEEIFITILNRDFSPIKISSS